jgi:hypothetical protein
MHSVVWFWLALVFGLIVVAEVAVVAWAVISTARDGVRERQQRRAQAEAEKSFPVEATIGPKDGKVEISYDRSVTNVSLAPEVARFLAGKIRDAADCAEKKSVKTHNLLPTAWDRLKDD